MTLTAMLREFSRRLTTNPLVLLVLVARRLRDDPLWVLLKVSGALGDRPKARLYPWGLRLARGALARRRGSRLWATLVAFFLFELGRRGEVVAFLDSRLAAARHTELRALARFSTEIDEADLALRLLQPLPRDHRTLRVSGRALARAGRYREALAELEAAVALDRDPSTRAERNRVAGNLEALEAGWRPLAPPAGAPPVPVPGRILHLLNNSVPYTLAGYTVRAHRIAKAQRDQGLDPHLLTKAGFPFLQGHFTAPETETVDGIPYYRMSAEGLTGLGMGPMIERNVERAAPIVTRLRPALLHPTSPHENAQVALGLRDAFSIPVVYEVRGFLEETWASRYGPGAEETDRYRLSRRTEARCMRDADHVVTLGEAMRAEIVARGVAADHVTVVPNAVDLEEFTPQGPDAALRARLGFDEDETVLGYVSSLVGYEGIGYLLGAARLLRDRGRRIRVLIVGDGAERRSLERQAEVTGLSGTVVFTGRVPHAEVTRYYELIDVFVVPRTGDRVSRMVTPLKPIEAMALERPVAVSSVEALLEIVRPGETGVAFEPEDPQALADAVEPLLDDAGLRHRLGKAAREWVAAERTWRRNGERYRDLYERLGVTGGRA